MNSNFSHSTMNQSVTMIHITDGLDIVNLFVFSVDVVHIVISTCNSLVAFIVNNIVSVAAVISQVRLME
ncbi:uncharacterized protein OCT59_010106 [Rhizophagus irregularis]|uniref:uncharacterized protein n=1 Tax=Rhizophagus irregularis TaxID=588596 RepID=UPI0033171470|nr:hypothetical protein OCT59_010106 [Rhizophagus irregularis]